MHSDFIIYHPSQQDLYVEVIMTVVRNTLEQDDKNGSTHVVLYDRKEPAILTKSFVLSEESTEEI